MVTDPSSDIPAPDPAAVPDPPGWAAPALLLALLMLGVDIVALIPLGGWMRDYGIGPVCAIYLIHVLASTGLAAWTIGKLHVFEWDADAG
ncbi:hypothetical protein ACIA5E_16910 [Nocardia asteroides]|uniref:hypothetical protein n=1 Tax=Nocardia asteroides TaxID=1824 RepID=UPI0037B6F111